MVAKIGIIMEKAAQTPVVSLSKLICALNFSQSDDLFCTYDNYKQISQEDLHLTLKL